MTDFVYPDYTPAERRMRETFLALMNALSRPGEVYTLPDAGTPFALIAESLLDLETSACTPHPGLTDTLAATGARLLAPDTAAYHFYEQLDEPALAHAAAASVGTHLRPDDAATLFIGGCAFGAGAADSPWTLRGPGIDGALRVAIDGVPSAFWTLRASRVRYPLGWDAVLLSGHTLLALPRTTTMTQSER